MIVSHNLIKISNFEILVVLAIATFGLFGGQMLPWSLGLFAATSVVFTVVTLYRPRQS